ncbi:hypothetical protein C4D60_Mb02t13030 [Musa balbisiana]|uniref:Uncharacterized protein n=1 Tax=Musa balbisiana TaxID=52838 RepID=A0A4V4H2M8_MUSBA|nr:hypothetical protein C4D60_Mb02t13030 [Musa balbisiana]
MSIRTSRTRRQSGKASALVPEEEDEGGEAFASTSTLHHSASSSSSDVALHLRYRWRRKRRQVKDPFEHSEGTYVIQHMIDRILT